MCSPVDDLFRLTRPIGDLHRHEKGYEKKDMSVTMADVARQAGTTTSTVSRVLNGSGYVKSSTRAAILVAIRELGYVPNANARALKTNRSNSIGVVIGDLLNPYAAELANAIRTSALARGYATLFGVANDEIASELQILETFHRQRLDGLVLATLQTEGSDQAALALIKAGIPVVLVGRTLRDKSADSVLIDFRQGGRAATAHLIELGHRRIAFIGARMEDAPQVGRLRGYLDAMNKAGLTVRPELILGGTRGPSPRYATQLEGYQGALEMLKLRTRPTAVFARNDHAALGVMQALTEAGLKVPRDVSVVGFDDIPIARSVVPALTTVRQPIEDLGKLASEFLLGRIERPGEVTTRREVTLDFQFIARGSTAAR